MAPCRFGPSCAYLKSQRCMYFHPVEDSPALDLVGVVKRLLEVERRFSQLNFKLRQSSFAGRQSQPVRFAASSPVFHHVLPSPLPSPVSSPVASPLREPPHASPVLSPMSPVSPPRPGDDALSPSSPVSPHGSLSPSSPVSLVSLAPVALVLSPSALAAAFDSGSESDSEPHRRPTSSPPLRPPPPFPLPSTPPPTSQNPSGGKRKRHTPPVSTPPSSAPVLKERRTMLPVTQSTRAHPVSRGAPKPSRNALSERSSVQAVPPTPPVVSELRGYHPCFLDDCSLSFETESELKLHMEVHFRP
jgi:hypothetical protein